MMKISEILKKRECDKKAKFSVLVDRTKINNWITFKNCLLESKEKLENYKIETKIPIALEKEIKNIETLYSRLLNHLSQYKIKDTNIFYEIYVNNERFRGNADFLLEGEDGIETVVLLKSGKNNFSPKARKAENKAENSLELLALKQAFPKAKAELWFLKGAKETSTNYSNVFDNVVELPEGIDVIEKFKENLKVKIEKDCSKCLYRSLCKEDLKITEQVEEKATKQAEITFTSEQKKVIALRKGVYSVLAGAGSGKTKVIVERAKNLEGKVLLITFTRKATAEIESRLGQVRNVEVSTIDGLVRKFCKDMEYAIADKISKSRLIEKALITKNLDMPYADIYNEFGLISKLLKAFNNFNVDDAKKFKLKEDDYMSLYDEYMRLYKGYMSYEELTQYVVKNNLAKKYDYVIVDEAQDISKIQYDLIKQLSQNIMLVGDDDQSIYGFRNGSNEFLLNLKKDYPNAKMIILSKNFRSSKQIVSLGNKLLSFNKDRYSKVLTANRAGTEVKIGIDIEEIKEMEGTTGIIARNHKDLDKFSKFLDKANIKYNKDEYLVDNIDTFRNIVNLYCNRDWDNDILLFQLLQKLDLFMELTEEDYLKNNAPMIEKLEEYAYYKITDIFYNLDKMSYKEQLIYLFNRLSIPQNIIEKLSEIPVTTLRELNTYLIDMVRFFDDTKINIGNEAVTLLTAHSSKGKEYDNVIVLNINSFFENTEDIDEARRLLYVSISRAKNKLILESDISDIIGITEAV